MFHSGPYKGLGTSTAEDAQVYFKDLDLHLKQFEPMKQEEVELIDLAFSKKKADEHLMIDSSPMQLPDTASHLPCRVRLQA